MSQDHPAVSPRLVEDIELQPPFDVFEIRRSIRQGESGERGGGITKDIRTSVAVGISLVPSNKGPSGRTSRLHLAGALVVETVSLETLTQSLFSRTEPDGSSFLHPFYRSQSSAPIRRGRDGLLQGRTDAVCPAHIVLRRTSTG